MKKFKNVKIGEKTKVGEYVIIGTPPKGKKDGTLPTVIGSDGAIRSHSVIYAGNTIGDKFQTGHGVLVRENNRIGDNVSIGTHSVVERDNEIGDNVKIHSNCFIPEFVRIEDNAWVGPAVSIMNVLHPPCPKWEECAKGIVIGRNAKIGGGTIINARVKIGENSVIGAGSLVINDVPPDSVAYGSPAKVVKGVKDLRCILGLYSTPYEWEK